MRILISLLLLLVSATVLAGPIKVQGVRLAALPDRTQLVFDISDPVEHQAFLLDNPHRLVLDVRDARRGSNMVGLDLSSREVKGVRTGIRQGTDLRIVVDLKGPARFASFLAGPRAGSGHRLVVDVYAKDASALSLYSLNRQRPPARLKTISRTITKMVPRSRDTVVVLDPGHGGKDPGAVGQRGSHEKDVVLAIAKRLKTLIDRQPGMRAVLTRSDDRYIPLYQRTAIALKHNADLFISI
ncbi:MAG: N-acetylmuramoyl-L-alanine amidase, partial [Candidatus Competibacteraceae bacterium]|nr:N-acetylmuramoyl-L-alanine amidase [Candidatus Competibacteraceae bacterium]